MKTTNFQHKEIVIKKLGHLSPGHKEWVKHMIDCMSVGICPKCWKALDASLKKSIKNIVVQCSSCNWEDSTEHNC